MLLQGVDDFFQCVSISYAHEHLVELLGGLVGSGHGYKIVFLFMFFYYLLFVLLKLMFEWDAPVSVRCDATCSVDLNGLE